MKKIAVIGCGALGRIFVENLPRALPEQYRIVGVLEQDAARAQAVCLPCLVTDSFEALLETGPDYIVEIAGGGAVRAYGQRALEAGCDLVVVSVGALADEEVRTRLERAALAAGRKVYVVNGAIGGLDLMQTLSAMGPLSVVIDNRKEPRSLSGAPHLEGRALSETEEEVLFRGGVQEAIAGFPKNVNVAVATALASETPSTEVVIRSVPGLGENQHIIHLKNDEVHATLSICSQADPANPKSSTSTAWSVIALFKNLASPFFYY